MEFSRDYNVGTKIKIPPFSISMISLVAFLLWSVAVESYDELVLIREVYESDNYNFTCISEDDSEALVWNDNLQDSIDMEPFLPNLPWYSYIDPYAPSINDTLKSDYYGDWKIVNSLQYPMGPVSDSRWEGFREYTFKPNDYHESYRYISEIPSSTKEVVFSARGLGNITIRLCEEKNHSADSCVEITLTAGSEKSSATTFADYADYAYEMTNAGESSKAYFHVKDENFQNRPTTISGSEWRTFILKWDCKIKIIMLCSDDGTVFENKTFKRDIVVNHLHVQSLDAARIRFHVYDYLQTNVNNTQLHSSSFPKTSGHFYVELLVSLCSGCSLEVYLFYTSNYRQRCDKRVISGDFNSIDGELLTWKIERLYLFGNVMIRITTRINDIQKQGRWVIGGIRTSAAPSIRSSSIILPKSSKPPHIPIIGCQKSSTTINSDAPQIQGNMKKIRNTLLNYFGKNFNYCEPTSLCKEKTFCTSIGCTCAPGFTGTDCNAECNSTSYGFNCEADCGFCAKNVRCDAVSGICTSGCADYYLPPYCRKKLDVPVVSEVAASWVKLRYYLEIDAKTVPIIQVFVKEQFSGGRNNISTYSHEGSFGAEVQHSRSTLSHSRSTNQQTSTLYNFSIRANEVHRLSLRTRQYRVPASISFGNVTTLDAFRGETSIKVRIPSVVNDTVNTTIYVIVIGSPACKNASVPLSLRNVIKIGDNEEGWIAMSFPSSEHRLEYLTIGHDPANDTSEDCELDADLTYVVLVAAVDEVDNATAVVTSTLPKYEKQKLKADESNVAWIFILIILIVSCLLIFIWRRKLLNMLRRTCHQDVYLYPERIAEILKSATTRNSQPPARLVRDDVKEPLEIDLLTEAVSWNRHSHPVHIKDFEEYVKESVNSGLLKSQYNLLPKGLTKPSTYGALPVNKPKNRYANIIPYDHTRVILKTNPDEPYSDYINANYVPGFRKEKAYIATQAPKPGTVVDFWRMIWQEETLVICMLTNTVDGQKVKCEQYWPDIGTVKMYGEITVLTESHCVFADYTFRTLRVSHENESRKIEHLHYTGWPDHTVPSYSYSLIPYLKKMLVTPTGNGPTVVHCSAGVGRTGTIMLCDICLRQAVENRIVDVLAEFSTMRNCRLNLVDNELQYIFAHILLVEYLVSPPTYLPCNNTLPDAIEKLKRNLPQHMQTLHTSKWQDLALNRSFSPRPPLPEHLVKNRFPELAPDCSNHVYLERYPRVDANSDYISAVVVDGFRVKKQFITTQLPLPSTLSDFWRLISEHRIRHVIILQRPDPNDPTCCKIVPDEESIDPVPFLHVEVKENSTVRHPDPEFKELLVIDSSESPARLQPVTILQCNAWGVGKYGTPPSPTELIHLWTSSENVYREEGSTLVVCHDGVTGCGLYLALSFLLERMALERECDIILAVRAVRRARPEFVQTQEQFQYLYDAAAKYIQSFDTYANFA